MKRLPGFSALFLVWALCPLHAAAQSADPTPDEQTLRAAGLTTEGPALLDFLRRRTQTTVEPDHLSSLITQLGDPQAATRAQASAELVWLGPLALPALRQAVNDGEERGVASRAQRCCQAIEPPDGMGLVRAVLRVLAQRRPEGATEVLLAYLPAADEETVLAELRETLTALALRDSRPDPTLLRALKDASPLRRAVAAEVLGGCGVARPTPALRELLKDGGASVESRHPYSACRAPGARFPWVIPWSFSPLRVGYSNWTATTRYAGNSPASENHRTHRCLRRTGSW